MKRYTIMGYMYGSDYETAICSVEHNPEAMVTALYGKRLSVWSGKSAESRKSNISKYQTLRIVDNHAETLNAL